MNMRELKRISFAWVTAMGSLGATSMVVVSCGQAGAESDQNQSEELKGDLWIRCAPW